MSLYIVIERVEDCSSEYTLFYQKDNAYEYAEQRRGEVADWVDVRVDVGFFHDDAEQPDVQE